MFYFQKVELDQAWLRDRTDYVAKTKRNKSGKSKPNGEQKKMKVYHRNVAQELLLPWRKWSEIP